MIRYISKVFCFVFDIWSLEWMMRGFRFLRLVLKILLKVFVIVIVDNDNDDISFVCFF